MTSLSVPLAEHPVDAAQIAVMIPCYNEVVTVAAVVKEFQQSLPTAKIYVYDNNSTDGTAAAAAAAGAHVRTEPLQGKGHVVRRMFSDIDADLYVLVDGDCTYEAAAAPGMIRTLIDGNLDLVNGVRRSQVQEAYRPGHRFGNWMLTALVALVFGRRTSDMLTGYRVFSRRFVKSFPSLTTGFEIETEIIVHALELRMLMADVETEYRGRPEGSASKLSTFQDGGRILRLIGVLIKEERPLSFFALIGLGLFLAAVVIFIPVFIEYLQTGLVRRFPTAILATGLVLAAMFSVVCGLVLSTVTLGRREMKRLMYLQQPGAGSARYRAG
ncbi:MAG TPA: glycosyltransferase family 2 protein [Steroidobacteraceae bacterium]|nr:glycosyltransferase family 2 protein [Steroidobacteraceae bacterium]